jgi:hypothetical protein
MFKKFFKSKEPTRILDTEKNSKTEFFSLVCNGIFSGAPYVIDGYWSFCDSKLDLVFPELSFWSDTLQKDIISGVIIQCVDLRDREYIVSLTTKCELYNLTLVTISDFTSVDMNQLRDSIFASVEKRLFSTVGE